MSNNEYWSQRYRENNTPWDMGSASPPLTAFMQQIGDKSKSILIPGAGNSYEAEWLWKNGFTNTHVLDIALEPLQDLKKRVPAFNERQLLQADFFNHTDQYDLIVEQTFFCALPPVMRKDYGAKMKDLLKPGGTLFGLLFDFPLTEDGPPFGGSQNEYRQLFSGHFKIEKLERCYNSIDPRQGTELFFKMLKP